MAATSEELALIVRARNMASAQLNSVSRDLDHLNTKTTRLGTAFTTAGRLAKFGMIAVTAAVVGGVAASVSAWSSFDAKMTESLAIMGDVSDETRDKMETAAREVAKTTTFSADEAAESYYFLASAGMTAEQSISALPQVALFAQAGMFDMATATDLATDAQSALGLVSDDAAENLQNLTDVTDILVGANTLANASVQQFSEALTNKAGAAMRALGMDTEEGVAVLAAFADQGLKGASAGTALHIVLRDLQTAALKNEDAFKAAGVSVYDSTGEFRNMSDIVGDLEGLLDGMSDAQKKATLSQLGFTDKSMGFIQTLLGTSDSIAEYESALRDAGGITQEVADKQLTSINAKWDLFKSKIKDVFIGLGKKLAPMIEKVMDFLGDFAENTLPIVIDKITEWGEVVWNVASIIVDYLVEAVRSVIDWWNNLSPQMQDAIKFGGILAIAFIGLAAAVGLVTTAVGLLLSPIVLVIAAIVAIGAGLKLAYDKFDWFKNVVDAVFKWFKEDALDTLKTAWEAIITAITTAWQIVQTVFEEVSQFIKDLWQAWGDDILAMAQTAWEFIVAVIETAWAVIKGIFEAVSAAVSWIWENWGDTIVTLAETAWGIITGIIDAAWQTLKGLFEFFTGLLTGDWSKLWDGLKGIASGAWTLVVTWFNGIKATFAAIWSEAWNGIKSVFTTIWDSLWTVSSTAWSKVTDWWSRVWRTFKTGWDNVWGSLSDAVSTAFGGVAGVISGILDGVKNAFYTAINWIIDKINALIRAYNRIPLAPDISEVPHVGSGRVSGGGARARLARGGTSITEGLALVGENGPEILQMNRGARVTPLTPTSLGGGYGGGANVIELHVHGVDLSDSRGAIEKIREGIRQLDLETG